MCRGWGMDPIFFSPESFPGGSGQKRTPGISHLSAEMSDTGRAHPRLVYQVLHVQSVEVKEPGQCTEKT